MTDMLDFQLSDPLLAKLKLFREVHMQTNPRFMLREAYNFIQHCNYQGSKQIIPLIARILHLNTQLELTGLVSPVIYSFNGIQLV